MPVRAFLRSRCAAFPVRAAGALEQCQEQIGALCIGLHRLASVVGVAFAGPLLHMLGHE